MFLEVRLADGWGLLIGRWGLLIGEWGLQLIVEENHFQSL